MKNSNKSSLTANIKGWFAISFSKDIKAGQNKEGFLANKHYILERHLNGSLSFNGTSKYIDEFNGIIFAWHCPQGSSPSWKILALDETAWTPFQYQLLHVHTHPQEVYENSVDLAHFSVVHKFSDLATTHHPHFEAHMMCVTYQIKRKNRILFWAKIVPANFELRLHGLGCAHTHINVPSYRMRVRMLTLVTPTHNGMVEIRIAVSIIMEVKNILQKILQPIIHHITKRDIVNDFCQDIPIWTNKYYLNQPLLVGGDGPIVKFRNWCKQFYCAETLRNTK